MKKIYILLLTLTVTSLSFGQVIITEIADPGDNANARFVEIYNVGTTSFDLTGYYLGRWTNANTTPTTTAAVSLTPIGSLGAGQFAIIAADGTAFTSAFGITADISAGTSGAAASNGDDQIAIFDASDAIVDLFGVPGEDGNNPDPTCHEFEDGRAERKAGVTSPVSTWNEAEWNVWSDSNPVSTCTSHVTISSGLDANLTNYDPGSWIGTSTSPTVSVGADVTGLDYFEGSGPSSDGTFTVEGNNLTADISLSSTTNFEISTTSGSGYSTSLTLTQSGGSVATTTIYSRLVAGLAANTYSGDVTIASTAATSQTVNLSGTVTAADPQITVTAFLDPFDYIQSIGGPSPEQTFTVEGLFLTTGITVTAPANYEVSLSTSTGFGSSVVVSETSGTVSSTTIYARLASGLAVGTYSGDVTVSASGVTSETIAVTGNAFGAPTNSLVLVGAYDGPLSGGTPKGIELYALADIPDLSKFGISRASNGGGSSGTISYNFPADALTAGDRVFLATESSQFTAFFGSAPTYINGVVSINGDDAIELYENGQIIDVFGTVDCDPNATGSTCPGWDHLDGWAYRVNDTGPDGSTFVESNWTFSGANALDGETTNATATTPYPYATYTNSVFSADQFDTNNFSLYPNPSKSDFVTITSTGSGAMQANVFDILGKQVINAAVTNGRLDVSPLNTGVYIVKLTQGQATTTKKLIIQ